MFRGLVHISTKQPGIRGGPPAETTERLYSDGEQPLISLAPSPRAHHLVQRERLRKIAVGDVSAASKRGQHRRRRPPLE